MAIPPLFIAFGKCSGLAWREWTADRLLVAECLWIDFLGTVLRIVCFDFAAFFAGVFLAAVGMLIPGMLICARAGAEKKESATVLTAINSLVFTGSTPMGGEPAGRAS
jgi:hypothetical protein